MADYTILIQVDPYTRVFRYTDQDTGEDLDGIALVNGDRLVWVLDPALTERTFQIDFAVLNPFEVGTAVTFRGADFIVSTPIDLPINYSPSREFKYSVSLGNGWHDDPRCLVVPEPPDPPSAIATLGRLVIQALTALARGATPQTTVFTIAWTDLTETAISVTPATPQTAQSSATSKRATVVWQWGSNVQQTQPFTLQFQAPPTIPAGWPTGPLSDTESITLSLPTSGGAAINFTINTNTPAQTAVTPVTGQLTVS